MQYNAENVRFIMAIDDFQRHLNIDKKVWRTNNWKEIDEIRDRGVVTFSKKYPLCLWYFY